MLTDTLYLPDHPDLTRANLAILIAMDQLLEMGQERGHTEPRGDHEDTPILAHRGADPMRSTEQKPAGAECRAPFACLSVVQKLPSKSPARFYEQIQLISLLGRPRGHHKRMALQEGPEAHRRDP